MLGGLEFSYVGAIGLAGVVAVSTEFVETLTVVFCIGMARGWRGAVVGSLTALIALILAVLTLARSLEHLPPRAVPLVVGTLVLLFGLRSLRASILRAAGVAPLHGAASLRAREAAGVRAPAGHTRRMVGLAVASSFRVVALDGFELAFIVIAIGAHGPGLLVPALGGAAAGLLLLVALRIGVGRPFGSALLDFLRVGAGVLVASIGTLWAGDGIGASWPEYRSAFVVLVIGYALVAVVCVRRASRQSEE